jgi:GDP-L-fucose synthase
MKILVTGGSGMVGSAFNRIDPKEHHFVLLSSKDADLRNPYAASQIIKDCQPDAIIHLAARVGGVKGNMERVAEYFEDNILINTNVLKEARLYSEIREKKGDSPVKVLSLLSTCIYPDDVNYPLTTDQIHNGPPHPSNFGYAYAKRMLDVHTRAISQQFDTHWITAVPNNIFGENDNFSLEHSHVVPALIRKIYDAKRTGQPVVLWGDGTALREFTYSSDIANILVWMLENYESTEPLNIGNHIQYCIKDVAELICQILDYPYDAILWDTDQPTGQLKKPSDNSNFLNQNNFKYTTLYDGIKRTCQWYVTNYPRVRGVL